MKKYLKQSQGVTLTREGSIFTVRYGRRKIQTDSGIVAIQFYGEFLLLALKEVDAGDQF